MSCSGSDFFLYSLSFHKPCLSKRGFLGGSDSKESTRNSGYPDLGSWEDSLEKEMAAHPSILAWRIPWTEEPGGLQSRGLQRVGHDLKVLPKLIMRLFSSI